MFSRKVRKLKEKKVMVQSESDILELESLKEEV